MRVNPNSVAPPDSKFKVVPEGSYIMAAKQCRQFVANTGTEGLDYEYVVLGGPHHGETFKSPHYLSPKALPYWCAYLRAIGCAAEIDTESQASLNLTCGVPFRSKVTHEQSQDGKYTNCRVSNFDIAPLTAAEREEVKRIHATQGDPLSGASQYPPAQDPSWVPPPRSWVAPGSQAAQAQLPSDPDPPMPDDSEAPPF